MANLQLINITVLHFCIWQHLRNNQRYIQLQHLATIPSIQVHKVYQHLLNSTMQLTPFNTKPSEDTDLYGVCSPPRNLCFSFRITHISRNWIILLLFLLVPTCQISTLTLQSGNMHYTIVDDNVEVAPIYRCNGKATKPTRPHENHGLAIEHLPTWSESHSKLQSKSFAVSIQGPLGKSSKIQGMQECT